MFSSFAKSSDNVKKTDVQAACHALPHHHGLPPVLSYYAGYAVRKRTRKTFFSSPFFFRAPRNDAKAWPILDSPARLQYRKRGCICRISRRFRALFGRTRMNRIYKRACFGLRYQVKK
jgi:hypothetical protein